MKIIKYIVLITSILTVVGCGKQLEVEPKQAVDSQKATKDVKLQMIGAYALLGSGGIATTQEGALYGTDIQMCADLLASTKYVSWQGTFSVYREILNKSIVSSNSVITRMWRKGYSAVNLCNTILENLGGLSSDDQKLYKGQAMFIRGIVYFELVRYFGKPYLTGSSSTDLGIPLLYKSTQSYESVEFPSRSTIESCYKRIIEDLDTAVALLPEQNDVYANKYVAEAFLSRVHLQRGEYDLALSYADDVIQNGGYSLMDSPIKAFNTSGTSESIFEIQQTSQNYVGTSNDGLTTFYACNSAVPGSAGRGDIRIRSEFVALFDSTDLRMTALMYDGDCGKSGPFTGKWANPYTNIPLIRLAEMYLIRAECNNRLGSVVGDEPVNDIMKLRSRANAFALTSVTLDDILMERQLELCFEGFRIHDIKRTQGSVGALPWDDGTLVFPIPQIDMNTNKNLVQNSAY